MMTQIIEFLPLTWETWIDFLAPRLSLGPAPATAGILVEGSTVCFCFYFSASQIF